VCVKGGKRDIVVEEGTTKIFKTANGNIFAKPGDAKYEATAYERDPETLAILGLFEQCKKCDLADWF
jgi:hypothetical protein